MYFKTLSSCFFVFSSSHWISLYYYLSKSSLDLTSFSCLNSRSFFISFLCSCISSFYWCFSSASNLSLALSRFSLAIASLRFISFSLCLSRSSRFFSFFLSYFNLYSFYTFLYSSISFCTKSPSPSVPYFAPVKTAFCWIYTRGRVFLVGRGFCLIFQRLSGCDRGVSTGICWLSGPGCSRTTHLGCQIPKGSLLICSELTIVATVLHSGSFRSCRSSSIATRHGARVWFKQYAARAPELWNRPAFFILGSSSLSSESSMPSKRQKTSSRPD